MSLQWPQLIAVWLTYVLVFGFGGTRTASPAAPPAEQMVVAALDTTDADAPPAVPSWGENWSGPAPPPLPPLPEREPGAEPERDSDLEPGSEPEPEPLVEWLETPLTAPLYRLNPDRPEVVLTFDDGPGAYTAQILDILAAEGVPAAFFWLSGNIGGLHHAKDVIAAGHQLGSHSVGHPQLTRLSATAVAWEIEHSQAILADAAGQPIVLFRPPYGAYNRDIVAMTAAAGMATVMWDVDPRDWDRASHPHEIVPAVMAGVRPGSIILLHERRQTVAILPDLIAALREAGYSFRLLPVPRPG